MILPSNKDEQMSTAAGRMIRALLAFLLLCGTACADFTVTDSQGNPLSTGMGWDTRVSRPTDAQVLASSLGPTIELLRDRTAIRPRDIGDDSAEDDTELLRWSLLVSRVLHVPLYIDREYRYSGLLEIQEWQTVFGNGPHAPGLKMNPASWFAAPDFSWQKLGIATVSGAHGSKGFTLRDLQIDGAQSEVDWQAVATGPHSATISQMLRESPSWAGLNTTSHDGRSIPDEVILENVHIHDTPGTCLFGLPQMRCRNLTLGNSVSGRVLYTFFGECFGLHTYGFSRTSIARVNAGCTIIGWTYRCEGHTNPWPENTGESNIVCAVQRFSGKHGRAELLNVDWDGSGSEFTRALKSNENCRVTGLIRNLGSYSDSDTQIGPYTVDLDLVAENSTPPDFATWGQGNVRNARVRWVNQTTNESKDEIDWSYTPTAYAVWEKKLHNAVRISVARKPWHAVDHEQRFDLHIDDDWPQWLVLHLPDLTIVEDGVPRLRRNDEVIPTVIRLSGRIDNRRAVWIGTSLGVSQYVLPQSGELEALPIRVILDGLNCNEITPGSFRGDHPWTIHAGLLSVRDRFPLATTVGLP